MWIRVDLLLVSMRSYQTLGLAARKSGLLAWVGGSCRSCRPQGRGGWPSLPLWATVEESTVRSLCQLPRVEVGFLTLEIGSERESPRWAKIWTFTSLGLDWEAIKESISEESPEMEVLKWHPISLCPICANLLTTAEQSSKLQMVSGIHISEITQNYQPFSKRR